MAKAAEDIKRPITLTLTAEQVADLADLAEGAVDSTIDAKRDANEEEAAELNDAVVYFRDLQTKLQAALG